MTIRYKDVYGNAPVALEKADEIEAFDLTLSSTPQQLPDKEVIEVILQVEGGDLYLGSDSLQNIKVPDGGTFILDVSNPKILYVKGSGTLHVLLLK